MQVEQKETSTFTYRIYRTFAEYNLLCIHCLINISIVCFSSQADVILLMTCSIRDNAEQKIWNMVNIYKGLKRRGGKKKPLKIGILGLKSNFSAILS